MALSVKQLSIDAPIPGKTYIGLQVQNRHRYPVTLREVIESDGFRKYQNGLGIALGKDIYGETYAAD
jgi:S-DNA-T family DNA segregation ATPase FtsK/SpoIIIE